MMATEQVEEILALSEKAAVGPWAVPENERGEPIHLWPYDSHGWPLGNDADNARDTAYYLAALDPQTVSSLATELLALRALRSERIEDFAALREVEEAWLAEHLSDAITNLGYPVGCGIAPHPETMAKAARNLFNHYARMVELARSAADTELLALRKRVGELERPLQAARDLITDMVRTGYIGSDGAHGYYVGEAVVPTIMGYILPTPKEPS